MDKGNLVNHIVKFGGDYAMDKYGEVLEQATSHVKCRELLRPEDSKSKVYVVGRHVYCGDREFYRTSAIIEVPIKQIKSSYPICSLQDYHQSKGFLLRQTYDPVSKSLSPELPKVCLCLETLNPDLNFFICPVCGSIYHYNCVGGLCPDCKLPLKRQQSETSDLESPKLPKLAQRSDSSLPLDLEKYKNLSHESKKSLAELVKSVQMNYLAMQNSLTPEEKTRQQIIAKIKCALLLACEEIKSVEPFEQPMSCIEALAISIEAAIYFSTGKKVSSQEYSKKIRSVIFNLQAEKNPDFRGSIVKGEIDPKALCRMQSKDMASSEIKNFRQERQKVYTKEQLILPTSSEKLMIKTHKGEAVFEINDKNVSDEFNTDILESLSKKRDAEVRQDPDDDPFNPNNYESIDAPNGEHSDMQMYETVKEWMPSAIMNKIRDRVSQHLTPEQSSKILSRINSFSINKSC